MDSLPEHRGSTSSCDNYNLSVCILLDNVSGSQSTSSLIALLCRQQTVKNVILLVLGLTSWWQARLFVCDLQEQISILILHNFQECNES